MSGPVILRVGRKVGRTVYRQRGPEPSDTDPIVGLMDTPELAALVVAAVNRWCLLDEYAPKKVLAVLRELERLERRVGQ